MLKCFVRDNRGATGIEYALLASMLAIAVLAAVQAVHVETKTSFENAGAAIAIGNAGAP